MQIFIRNLFLVLVSGIYCQLFFETIVPKRNWKHSWVAYTVIPAFAASRMVIAVTAIPAYFLQPVRLIVSIAVIAQIYYQLSVRKNLFLSVLFCVIYWIVSTVLLSVAYLLPDLENQKSIDKKIETSTELILLCLMILFHSVFKSRFRGIAKNRWNKFAIFPVLGIIILTALNYIPWSGNETNKYARLITILGLAILNICIFYFMISMVEKEEEMQTLRLSEEYARNQITTYNHMYDHFEEQKRFLHDYKNQLYCIQGLLDGGQTKEAVEYISKLTGNLNTNTTVINTNNLIINVILNQKYQSALRKEIAMTFVINDLSRLTIAKDDLVILLTNLLDNAIEACEKLYENKIIQFKMVLEEEQLILSVRNPIQNSIHIKNRLIATSKQDSIHHGIGLLNIDSVIKNNKGTSILQCKDGWFCFSAMIPCAISQN